MGISRGRVDKIKKAKPENIRFGPCFLFSYIQLLYKFMIDSIEGFDIIVLRNANYNIEFA